MLSGFFGGLALLLAAIGLYGVVAQAVRTRRSEIGLRMALGARPAGIIRLVFRRVGVLIAAGLALGLAGSVWAARFVAPLLFQVEARDPLTFAGAAAVLIAVSVLAAWVARRRAAGSIRRRRCAKAETVLGLALVSITQVSARPRLSGWRLCRSRLHFSESVQWDRFC